MNGDKKFDGKAYYYDKARPQYAQGAVDWVRDQYLKDSGLVVADIGSGTGKLTAQLLNVDNIKKVIAIEPNGEMRKVCDQKYCIHPKYVSLNEYAENTTVVSNSIDAIFVGQAFHWFDKVKFKEECNRILCKNGNVFIFWNAKNENQPIRIETNQIMLKYVKDYDNQRTKQTVDEDLQQFFDGKVNYVRFANSIKYNKEQFVNLHFSMSYSITRNDDNATAFINDMEKVFDKYQHNDYVILEYTTEINYGKVE